MFVLPGPPALEVHLRRSAQARRFSLRVSRLDGKISLTLPKRARLRDASAFVNAQEDWLREVLAQMPCLAARPLAHGDSLPILGEMHHMSPTSARRLSREGGHLYLPGPSEAAGAKAAAYLKLLAREKLTEASNRYAAHIGCRFQTITLRDTRSRWGSCSHSGTLMYSWRLAMAPPDVLDYVAAHEVAHLREMNHAPAFWALVSALRPDWRIQRDWLKLHGHSLHHYRFTDARP